MKHPPHMDLPQGTLSAAAPQGAFARFTLAQFTLWGFSEMRKTRTFCVTLKGMDAVSRIN